MAESPLPAPALFRHLIKTQPDQAAVAYAIARAACLSARGALSEALDSLDAARLRIRQLEAVVSEVDRFHDAVISARKAQYAPEET